jgi:hypothetical protein
MLLSYTGHLSLFSMQKAINPVVHGVSLTIDILMYLV